MEEALTKTRRGWKQNNDMRQYKDDMDIISQFAEVSMFKYLSRLDFHNVPNSLRSKIVNHVHRFPNLKELVLTSGSGQWLSKTATKK